MVDILTCSDRQYWEVTGLCGGCISEECHPGVSCRVSQEDGHDCRYCPGRFPPHQRLTPPGPKPEPDPNQGELF
jgi:hypothetical protein